MNRFRTVSHSLLNRFSRLLLDPAGAQGLSRAELAEQARKFAPVLWLVGKVQSGKTSIIQHLTGAPRAVIGKGFRACTRDMNFYDFPADMPVLRFLDMRGLGEAGYDPAADVSEGLAQAHMVLAVMRASDADQGAVLDVLHEARRQKPKLPILVAQTCLHEFYPRTGTHIMPYPFVLPGAVLDKS